MHYIHFSVLLPEIAVIHFLENVYAFLNGAAAPSLRILLLVSQNRRMQAPLNPQVSQAHCQSPLSPQKSVHVVLLFLTRGVWPICTACLATLYFLSGHVVLLVRP